MFLGAFPFVTMVLPLFSWQFTFKCSGSALIISPRAIKLQLCQAAGGSVLAVCSKDVNPQEGLGASLLCPSESCLCSYSFVDWVKLWSESPAAESDVRSDVGRTLFCLFRPEFSGSSGNDEWRFEDWSFFVLWLGSSMSKLSLLERLSEWHQSDRWLS